MLYIRQTGTFIFRIKCVTESRSFVILSVCIFVHIKSRVQILFLKSSYNHFLFSPKNQFQHFLFIFLHRAVRIEGPQAKQPSSASCGVRLLCIMTDGGRRCSSSSSADKLSLLGASVSTVRPFLQSHQQRRCGTAHRAASQQPPVPPGRQHIYALMVSQCCLFGSLFFPLASSTRPSPRRIFRLSVKMSGASSASLI